MGNELGVRGETHNPQPKTHSSYYSALREGLAEVNSGTSFRQSADFIIHAIARAMHASASLLLTLEARPARRHGATRLRNALRLLIDLPLCLKPILQVGAVLAIERSQTTARYSQRTEPLFGRSGISGGRLAASVLFCVDECRCVCTGKAPAAGGGHVARSGRRVRRGRWRLQGQYGCDRRSG